MTSAEQKDVAAVGTGAPVNLWTNIQNVLNMCQELLQFNEKKTEAKFMDLLKTYPKCFTLHIANHIWSWLCKAPRNSLSVFYMLEAMTSVMTRLTQSSADALARDWDTNVMSLRRVLRYAMHWPALPDDQKPVLGDLFQRIEVFLHTMRRIKSIAGSNIVCDGTMVSTDFRSWDFANAKSETAEDKANGMVTVALKTPNETTLHVNAVGSSMWDPLHFSAFNAFKTEPVKHYIFVSAIKCKTNVNNQLQHLSLNWFCTPCV